TAAPRRSVVSRALSRVGGVSLTGWGPEASRSSGMSFDKGSRTQRSTSAASGATESGRGGPEKDPHRGSPRAVEVYEPQERAKRAARPNAAAGAGRERAKRAVRPNAAAGAGRIKFHRTRR